MTEPTKREIHPTSENVHFDITLRLNRKEIDALDELCDIRELTRNQILINALRIYQGWTKGLFELKDLYSGGGCGGDE